ncbi:hypothetical protein HDU96_007181 [Phlyctochytrium bullatum]|nr:hypothetical protein HDU96_007181 [Phlyctochytrium bullatum]
MTTTKSLSSLLYPVCRSIIRTLPPTAIPGGEVPVVAEASTVPGDPEQPAWTLHSLIEPEGDKDLGACLQSILQSPSLAPDALPSPLEHDPNLAMLFSTFAEAVRGKRWKGTGTEGEATTAASSVSFLTKPLLKHVVGALCKVFDAIEAGKGEKALEVVLPPSPESIIGTGTEVKDLEERRKNVLRKIQNLWQHLNSILRSHPPSNPTSELSWSWADQAKGRTILALFLAGTTPSVSAPPPPTTSDIPSIANSFPRSACLDCESVFILLSHRVTLGTVTNRCLPPSALECFMSSLQIHPKDAEAEVKRLAKMAAKRARGGAVVAAGSGKGKEEKETGAPDGDVNVGVAGGSKTLLTVAARALAKHAHRDEQGEGWGGPLVSGTVAAKNVRAAEVLGRIFGDPVWMNLHQLPHNTLVYELRNSEGYGTRFYIRSGAQSVAGTSTTTETTSDELSEEEAGDVTDSKPKSLEFRGFLEPPMENGHEVGWRH